MNDAINGIPLSNSVHLGSHDHYDNKILQRLNDFMEQNPNASPSQCYDEIQKIIMKVRTAIQNHPTTHINELNF